MKTEIEFEPTPGALVDGALHLRAEVEGGVLVVERGSLSFVPDEPDATPAERAEEAAR